MKIAGLEKIIGVATDDAPIMAQARGPASQPDLPITYWYPGWWGISPWASPYWTTGIVRR